jgi:Holliday junction resolvase
MTQPESRLQRSIQDALRRREAFVFKVHGSEYMMKGLPDLVVCYKGLFIGFEVKTDTGTVSAIQRHRLVQIRLAGGIAFVVRSVEQALRVLDQIDATRSGKGS